MKRASYRAAIEWIAQNDSAGDQLSQEDCGALVTAVMVADLFQVDSERVGRDVYRQRAKEKRTWKE